jgi:ketosteroid isomerase-like protein
MRRLMAVTLCAFGLSHPSLARAQGDDAVKQAEGARCAAIAKGDFGFLAKQTSADYVLISTTGQMTGKKEMVDNFRSGTTKFTRFECSDVKVRMYGKTAVTTGMVMATGKASGRDVSGQRYRFTRVWVKEAGGWRAVSLQQTEVSGG